LNGMPGREADSGLIGRLVRAERAGGVTCIRTDKGCLYPSLLTDLRSRKTAGCHAGDTLEAEGAVRALETALSGLPKGAFTVRTAAASIARAGMLKSSRPAGLRQAWPGIRAVTKTPVPNG
jgi:hypothetical protein